MPSTSHTYPNVKFRTATLKLVGQKSNLNLTANHKVSNPSKRETTKYLTGIPYIEPVFIHTGSVPEKSTRKIDTKDTPASMKPTHLREDSEIYQGT